LGNPYLAEIKMMSFNFPPKGWAFCNGQTMAINQNQALFALLGTTYGGNGVSTFQLPNLQSRAPVHQGSSFVMGQTGGLEQVTIDSSTMASHSHVAQAVNVAGLSAKPLPTKMLARSGSGTASAYAPPSSLVALNPASIQPTASGGAAHTNIQPYLALNYCIALQGIFPSRN
jgi:microcystin-dependent protein